MKAILLVALFACFSTAYAEDLGVIGEVYPIHEEDLIEAIKSRLKAMQDSGELDAQHRELTDRSRAYVRRPPGVSLPRAERYQARPFDLSFTLQESIKDAEGNTLFEKGITINPLSHRPLTRALCFINGDDSAQVIWLEEACPVGASKSILVNGDIAELMQALGRRLYFDQAGVLVQRFEITALPAVVRQSDEVLYVEQFPIE